MSLDWVSEFEHIHLRSLRADLEDSLIAENEQELSVEEEDGVVSSDEVFDFIG